MTITGTPVDNGVNTAALLGARDALTAAPEAAEFTWRATTSWVNGTHSRSTVERFSGLGQEHTHESTFTFDADHPECFASEDHGATPVENVLVALGSCLTAGVAAVAQHRGIQLRKVTATVEGDMNVLGILGADPDDPQRLQRHPRALRHRRRRLARGHRGARRPVAEAVGGVRHRSRTRPTSSSTSPEPAMTAGAAMQLPVGDHRRRPLPGWP